MNVDLLTIINNTEKEINFEGKTTFTDNDCVVNCNVCGKASTFSGRIEVTMQLDAVVDTKCARCLKPLQLPIKMDVEEVVGEDGVVLEGTILDVGNIAKNNIVVELPIRFLCNDNCKGICSSCGADLNITECNCKHEQFDERFAVLKKLLDSGNKPE